MFRWGWERHDATLIDQRFVRRTSANVHRGIYYQVWNYMVEIPTAAGGPKRLVIREKTFKLDLPDVSGTVPVLVDKKRTKAAFDLTPTGSARTSTRCSITIPRLVADPRIARGIIDTSVVIDLGHVAAGDLPAQLGSMARVSSSEARENLPRIRR